MSLLFNMLSRLVITFLPRSKHFLISWLQTPSAVISEPKKRFGEWFPPPNSIYVYLIILFITCVCVALGCVQLFKTPLTVAHQAPLSMEISRQEHWSELPFPPPGYVPDPRIEPTSLEFFFIGRQILYHCATWKAIYWLRFNPQFISCHLTFYFWDWGLNDIASTQCLKKLNIPASFSIRHLKDECYQN